MELRPYQQKVIQEVFEAWEAGHQNVLVQMATGGGKTVVFSTILRMHKGPSIAIAHRVELVSQISLTLARHGLRHNIIAPKSSIKEIVAIHVQECGKSFYDPYAICYVAGVDTLIRLPASTEWLKHVTLIVQDEAHHVLRDNKWGKAAAMFPMARGLYPTATPVRADGKGLGRATHGVIDHMVVGVPMRQLIKEGFLTEYRIFAPPSTLDILDVPVTAAGDFSPPKLRTAVRSSSVTGDVVEHYLKIAHGKLGVTFAVDIESAGEIAQAFKIAGVAAEVISSKTPDLLRAHIMRRFRNREILQLVNVDILGEGVDVPAIEVISFARPTQSYALYSQQFGRALRPMEGKTHAIIIDHVGNVLRHGLPDAVRQWSLDARDAKRKKPLDAIALKTCGNMACFGVYPRTYKSCPYCGIYTPPADRSKPEYVDGDLFELDEEVLNRLRGEVEAVNDAPVISPYLMPIVQATLAKRHRERQQAQVTLREAIAQWAGYRQAEGLTDSEIYRAFYLAFGVDVMTAQTLNERQALELCTTVTAGY